MRNEEHRQILLGVRCTERVIPFSDAMGGSVILYTDPEKALRELAKIEAGD